MWPIFSGYWSTYFPSFPLYSTYLIWTLLTVEQSPAQQKQNYQVSSVLRQCGMMSTTAGFSIIERFCHWRVISASVNRFLAHSNIAQSKVRIPRFAFIVVYSHVILADAFIYGLLCSFFDQTTIMVMSCDHFNLPAYEKQNCVTPCDAPLGSIGKGKFVGLGLKMWSSHQHWVD